MSAEQQQALVSCTDRSVEQVETAHVVEDWCTLVSNADSRIVSNEALFVKIGTHLQNIEQSHDDVGNIVRQLRSIGIKLLDWSSFEVAKWYMKQGYQSILPKSLDKYCCHLRSLLALPPSKLPDKISISAPVPSCYNPGDEIDVLDTKNHWWHGVLLSESRDYYNVYWVGTPPSKGNRKSVFKHNPQEVKKHSCLFRVHEDDAVSGESTMHTVEWILANVFSTVQPRTFREVVHISVDDAEEEVAPDSTIDKPSQGTQRPRPKPSPEPKLGNKPRKPTPTKKPRGGLHSTAASQKLKATVTHDDDENDADDNDSKTDDDGYDNGDGSEDDVEDDADDDDADGNKPREPSPTKRPRGAASRRWRPDYSVMIEDAEEEEMGDSDEDEDGNTTEEDGGEEEEQEAEEFLEQESSRDDTDQGASDSGDDAGPPLYHITQVFNDVDEAVETLVCLDAGLPPHPTLYRDMASKLTRVASFLAKMYSNTAYKDLVSSTLKELEGYEGRQEPRRFHSKNFLKALSKFGFCITPRMWKMEEILCIAISVLDPRLDFQGIQQKDGINSKTSFRGMAVLNSSIQRIFYTRLRSYGFVNPRYHPERLQAFSSVVINGGGSWQKSSTWEFCKQSCFNIDKTASPFIVRVSSDVGALETAGVYVASTTKKNGKPVYVQVSKREFQGFSGQVAFNKCFKPECKEVIQKYTTNTQGPRIDACSPRVLVCLKGDHEWGIQLLPGYGSDFCICKFDWRGGQTSNIQRFTSFDFDKFKAKMQPCALSITSLFEHAADCLTTHGLTHGHTLSFGTVKIMKSCFLKDKAAASFKVTPLTPQGWHTDGPRNYNDSVFDGFGNLRSDAAECANRKTAWKGRWTSLWKNPLQPYLPDHIGILQESFSALFGIFKGTFIETPASLEASRSETALKVPVPLGCAVVFTFAWKHRGKGDDPAFQATPQCPVSVHARPHFYAYSSDIRKLPSVDCETSLEFISICSQIQVSRGSQSQILDCLQTFDHSSAPGHDDDPDVHQQFGSQRHLDDYVSSQLREQCLTDEPSETCITCCDWYLWLESPNEVHLLFRDNHPEPKPDCCVTIIAANFDSDKPSFRDSDDKLYNLIGTPAKLETFPAKALVALALRLGPERCNNLLHAANQATQALFENWCESSLLRLLSILNFYAIADCTLTIALGHKEQSRHKFVLSLEGNYLHDNSAFKKELARPDSEGVAELYRECLKQLVINAGGECGQSIDMKSFDAALKGLEQSSGLFNVGFEDVLEYLEMESSKTSYPLEINFTSVFMLGTRCVMMTERITLEYSVRSSTKRTIVGASAPTQASEHATLHVPEPDPAAPASVLAVTRRARNSTGTPAVRDDLLPTMARGGFPTDVHADDLIWDAWEDCMITGVGTCNVWNVYTSSRSYDNIAIQLLGTSEKFTIADRTIHYDDSSKRVICQQVGKLAKGRKRQIVRFEQVCPCFEAWARERSPRNYTDAHIASLNAFNLVRVDCGGAGDCFYLSCAFGLTIYDKPSGIPDNIDALALRKATVNHLRTCSRHIMTPTGTLHNLIFPDWCERYEQLGIEERMETFCDIHQKRGAYVEDPCLRAFAALMGICIIVYHTTVPDPQFYNQEEGVSRRILYLWCDGGHYQVRCRPLPQT